VAQLALSLDGETRWNTAAAVAESRLALGGSCDVIGRNVIVVVGVTLEQQQQPPRLGLGLSVN